LSLGQSSVAVVQRANTLGLIVFFVNYIFTFILSLAVLFISRCFGYRALAHSVEQILGSPPFIPFCLCTSPSDQDPSAETEQEEQGEEETKEEEEEEEETERRKKEVEEMVMRR
jgi:hypothetical protein